MDPKTTTQGNTNDKIFNIRVDPVKEEAADGVSTMPDTMQPSQLKRISSSLALLTDPIKRYMQVERSTPWSVGCGAWCKKYFKEGQRLTESHQQKVDTIDPNTPLHKRLMLKYRRPLSLIIPAVFYHFFWWGVAIEYNIWHLFAQKYYAMSITMVFGSMIAGMTSEGGGAVAFPVMTLALKVSPAIARDFSLMIQSCGMTAAAFTVFFMKIQLEWHSLVFCSVGGLLGTIFGLEVVDPRLTAPQKKMGFVSIWFSFAFALFLLNRYHKRKTYRTIQGFGVLKGITLFLTGIIGGIFTAFAGSGLDICSFSVLTLLFRVSEKTATPTSVVLMAGNTVVGFYWRGVMMKAISYDAWAYFAVCVPIVVIGAPLGSLIGSHFHRQVLAALVYILDTAALVGAFVLVKQTPVLAGVSVGIIVFGFIFFGILTKVGQLLHKSDDEKLAKEKQLDGIGPVGQVNAGYVGTQEEADQNVTRVQLPSVPEVTQESDTAGLCPQDRFLQDLCPQDRFPQDLCPHDIFQEALSPQDLCP